EDEFEDRFGLGGDEDADEHQADAEPGVPEAEIEDESTGVFEHPPEQPIEDDDTGVYEVPPEPEPAPPEPAPPEPEPEPEQDWPDLSAELEELDFYLAQDLEEDALAAYNDLVELFPGHPELAKLAPRFGLAPPPPPPTSPVEPVDIEPVDIEPVDIA